MRRFLLATVPIAAVVATPALAPAQSDEERERSPEALAKEGITKLLDALELLIDEIPQYAAPEVLPNGDIIIRRLDPVEPEERAPEEDKAPPEPGEPEET